MGFLFFNYFILLLIIWLFFFKYVITHVACHMSVEKVKIDEKDDYCKEAKLLGVKIVIFIIGAKMFFFLLISR